MRQYQALTARSVASVFCSTVCQAYDRLAAFLAKAARFRLSLVSFDDLLLDDFDSTAAYIYRRKFAVVYRFLLIFITTNYLLCPCEPSLAGRMTFSVLMLYAVIKVRYFLSDQSLSALKYVGLIDILIGHLLSTYFGLWISALQGILISSFLFLALCFLSPSLAIGLLGAAFSGISKAVMFGGGGAQHWLKSAFHFALLDVFLLALTQSYHAIVMEHCHHFFNARQKLQSDGQTSNLFVASITHDLKSPLNSLLGCVDQLTGSTALTRSDKRLLRTAILSGQILGYLINNILDMAKIQAGKFEIDRLPMAIIEELSKVLKVEGEISKKKGITLYKKCLTPVPKLVYGDPMRFAEVMLNLLSNSIKFTSKGYVAVLVRWARNVDEIQYQEQKANRKFSRDEDDAEFIPSEEYFMLGPRICAAPTPLQSRSQLCPPMARHVPRNEDEGGDVNEGLTEQLADKMARYSAGLRSHKVMESLSLSIISPIIGTTRPGLSNTRGLTESGTLNFGGATTTHQQSLQQLREQENARQEREEEVSEIDKMEAVEDEADEGDSGLLVVDIIDTGVGMTHEEQERLFKPFSQANSSIKSTFGGTGLGLCIAKQLTHLMSGFIDVKSQKGKGTRFRLTLPLKVVRENISDLLRSPGSLSPHRAESGSLHCGSKTSAFSSALSRTFSQLALGLRRVGRARFAGCRGTIKGMRVLIIEHETAHDDEQLEQVLCQLKEENCEVSYSSYGGAVQTLKEQTFKFDSILILSAPGVQENKELIERLTAAMREEGGKHIPFAVASGMFSGYTTGNNRHRRHAE